MMRDSQHDPEQGADKAEAPVASLSVESGTVYLVSNHDVRLVTETVNVELEDVIIGGPKSTYVVIKNGEPVLVSEPCPTCIKIEDNDIEVIGLAENAALDELSEVVEELGGDVAALQRAILEGVDPTREFEAPAAGVAGGQGGGSAGSSSIGDAAVIQYNNASVLASAGFQTSYTPSSRADFFINDDNFIFVPPAGGESLSVSLTEGDLVPLSNIDAYPVSASSTVLVEAGTAALDAESFQFDPTFVTALIAELSDETQSSGRALSYAVSDDGRTLEGFLDGEPVIAIVLIAEPVGRNVELSLTVTVFKPLDEIQDNVSGLVKVTADRIDIALEIQGSDTNGNPLQQPVSGNITIIDGQDPSLLPDDIRRIEDGTVYVSDPVPLNVDINSDELQAVRFVETPELTQALSSITSLGLDTVYSITDDAITVSLADDPSVTVLALKLVPFTSLLSDSNYGYVLEQSKTIDQQSGEDRFTIPVTVAAVDREGDSGLGTFTVTIFDGDNASGEQAEISGEFALTEDQLDEPAQTATGTILLDAGADSLLPDTIFISNLNDISGVPGLLSELNELSSNGEPLVFALVTGTAPNVIELVGKTGDGSTVLSISLVAASDQDAQGGNALGIEISSSMTLFAPLDHHQPERFANNRWVTLVEDSTGTETFKIDAQLQVRDTDNDLLEAPINLVYSVTDGITPGIGAESIAMTDPAYDAPPVVETGSLGLSVGSDRIVSVTWDLASSIEEQVNQLTSNGNPLQFLPSFNEVNGSDSPIEVGYVTDAGEIIKVLTVILDPTNNRYSVTLSHAIDEPQNDVVALPFNLKVTDADGDIQASAFTVSIKDGPPPSVDPVDTVLVDPAVNETAFNESVDLGLAQGTDAVQSIRLFAPDGLAEALNAITSSGYQTSVLPQPLSALDNEIVVVIDDPTLSSTSAPANGTVVMRISLDLDENGNPKDAYTVYLGYAIDQPSGPIVLPVGVQVTDTDGDVVTGEFTVTIQDNDESISPAVTDKLPITEPDLTPDDDEKGYPDSASVSFDVKATNDRLLPGDVGINSTLQQELIANMEAVLTSDGRPLSVTYDVTTHTLSATADGEPVMTVTFPAVQGSNGVDLVVSPVVTLYQPLDHIADNPSNDSVLFLDDFISISLSLQTLDSDGDVVSSIANMQVVVFDGKPPEITQVPELNVEESDINKNGSGSDVNRPGTTPGGEGEDEDSATGTLALDSGSDAITSITLDVDAFASLNADNSENAQGEAVPLSSNGETVSLTLTDDGTTSKVYTGLAGTREVFTLTIFADGTYTFALLGAIDHPLGEGKNSVAIRFPVVVSDSDKDIAESEIVVNVQDDVPFTLETDGVDQGGGSLEAEEGYESNSASILPDRNKGADGAEIKSVTINGVQHELVSGTNTFQVNEDSSGQLLGTLTIKPNGFVQFKAVTDVVSSASGDNQVTQSFSYEIIDGDGDIVVGSTDIIVVDEVPQLIVHDVAGVEDQGREPDPDDEQLANPEDGIPIEMEVDIGDADLGESVSRVVITLPPEPHGTFYANGVALPISDGKVTIPGSLFSADVSGELWALEGVTFVPDQDFSTQNDDVGFLVTAYVAYADGSESKLAADVFNITVDGIADVPQWNTDQTDLYYRIAEDSDGAALNLSAELQDADGSETLTYILTLTSGSASLLLNGETLTPTDGQYVIAASDINQVVVKPDPHFAGDITLTVTAQSQENANAVPGQQTADSITQTITVAVEPVGDSAVLSVSRASGLEDELIPLSPHISLTDSDDLDGSETLFVRISGLPDGATLLLANGTEVPQTGGVYEVAYDNIGGLSLLPPPESNLDFALTVRGVVKDGITITDANGNPQTVSDVYETDPQVLNVALKGVADTPEVEADLGNIWQPIVDSSGETTGIETTIAEDGKVSLSFRVVSGETGTAQPGDSSETLSTLVTNIPEGVTLLDTDNSQINLVYAGMGPNGEPQYQARVDGLADVKLVPPPGSTADITLTVVIVVTEDDGDSLSVTRDVVVHIEPAIDASDYALTSRGLEDQNVVVNWRPDTDDGFTENNEEITAIAFTMAQSAIDAGYTLTIAGESSPLTFSGEEVVLTSAQVSALLGGAQLLLRAPEDSDLDENINLEVTLTVQQTDVDSAVINSKEIIGTLDVRIVSTVENDGNIALVDNSDTVISNTIDDAGSGAISFAPGSDHQLVFVSPAGVNTDGSSVEEIVRLVLTFVKDANGTPLTDQELDAFDNFYIAGAINNGDGSWTVPESALDSLAISTSSPTSDPVFVQVSALVQDQGDEPEGDASANAEQSAIVLTLTFTGNTDQSQLAGDINVDAQTITGTEDNAVDLGQQLDGQISVDSANAADDELTLVIDASALGAIGAAVTGMTYNFETGEYVAKVSVSDTGTVDLSGISLIMPKHFAGDATLPIKLVTTDELSGDVKELETSVTIVIDPVVDGVKTSVTVVETNGLDSEEQPVTDPSQWVPVADKALEDGIIELDFSAQLVDTDTSATSGVETISQSVLTVDSKVGFFVDADGQNPQSTITVSGSDLSQIYFKPVEDFSGTVSVSVSTTVIDETENDDTGQPNSSVQNTVDETVTFEVLPVNDPLLFGGNTEPVTGNEDSQILLSGVTASLKDSDGSEQIVSVKLIGVPDDFQIISTGSQLVQNSGGGNWTVSVPAGSQSLNLDDIALVPPKNFSGSLSIEMEVYAKEATLDTPQSFTTSIDINVLPIGDAIDAQITPSVTGAEDEDIILPLNLTVVDKVDTYDGTNPSVTENSPETIKVVLTNVPESATISLPDGVADGSSVEEQPDGSWVVIVNQTTLSSLILSPGDANEGNWDGQLGVSIRAVDNGVEADSSLWIEQMIDVKITPVNDDPILTVPVGLDAEEETPLLIQSLRVTDIDAAETADGVITLTLSVTNGVLAIPASTTLPDGVTVSGEGSSTMTLEGSLDGLNQLLTEGITYTGDLNFSGLDSLTVTVNDNGNTGSGGAKTDAESVSISVQPKPDIPTLTLSNAQTAAVAGSVSSIIPLLGLAAALTDPAEVLSVELRGIPDELQFVNASGDPIGVGPVAGVLTLTPDELTQLYVTGSGVISSSVEVVAISTTTEGESAESAPLTLKIDVSEAADGAIVSSEPGVDNAVVSGNEAATLEGEGGSDTLIGGLGEDILIGGEGDDVLWGGKQGENDTSSDRFVWLQGDLGSPGAPASDTIEDFDTTLDVVDLSGALNLNNLSSFSALTDILTLSESNGSAVLTISESGSAVQAITFSGVTLDTLVNDSSPSLSDEQMLTNVINSGLLYLGANFGDASANTLVADAAGESLFGMNGNDTLEAGLGNDILTGGEGDDLFVWSSGALSTPANTDTVTDLTLGQDKLDISQLLDAPNPDATTLAAYFNEASVDSDGTINLSMVSNGNTQNMVLQNMDISSTGLNLSVGSSVSEIINALYDNQAFKLD